MKTQNLRAAVRWADGTFDAKRVCDECHNERCKYPVHKDYYREVITSKAIKEAPDYVEL